MDRKSLGKIMACKTMEEMLDVARRYGILVDGKIDFRGRRLKFDHKGIDLSRLLLEGANLTGSSFENCSGEGASFKGCILAGVAIRNKGTYKSSFKGADFRGVQLSEGYLGPRTLDLSQVNFAEADLRDVTFMLGNLAGADFTRSNLTDVAFRKARLDDASFREARLERVSLEEARLAGADFTGAQFVEMEWWGDPDYTSAIISGELRYRHGMVEDPLPKLDRFLALEDLSVAEQAGVLGLRDQIAASIGPSNAVLLEEDGQDVLAPELFRRVLKSLKDM
ncbi:MAG TPA: pentapeptide repeat-containing protein [Thermoanaerobaculia bacterium]|nr:pentapeptide repeat-containing protein [Thermoanaerobaculia bacterium]